MSECRVDLLDPEAARKAAEAVANQAARKP